MSPIVTSVLLILSILSRCWLLILILWLILTRRLLILSGGNIRIRIIWHVSHRKIISGMDICRYNTYLPFFLFCKAPTRLLIYSLLSRGTCDLSWFHPILDTFTNSHHVCEASRRTSDHFLKVQPWSVPMKMSTSSLSDKAGLTLEAISRQHWAYSLKVSMDYVPDSVSVIWLVQYWGCTYIALGTLQINLSRI